MSDIKIVYFDSIGLNQSLIESKLINLKIKYCVIKEGLLLVRYSDCSKQLFNQLLEADNRHDIFIADLDMSNDSYWGFLNKAVWEWLNENKNTESADTELIKS
mgnify:FL=1